MADRQLYGIGFVFGAEEDASLERVANNVRDSLDGIVRTSGDIGSDSSREINRFASEVRGLAGTTNGVRSASRAQEEAKDKTSRWHDALTSLFSSGDSGARRLSAAMSAAVNSINLNTIRSQVEGLTDSLGGLDVSSTGLESHGAQFGQTYRQATAGLGQYRAEVDAVRGQISGLSYSLGVGAEGMIAYAAGVARAGHSLEDFGLSMRDVAGLEQAGIMQGAELAALLTDLSNSYSMGADGATDLMDRMVALGESFGFGADVLRQMPSVMSAISPVARDLGWTGEQAGLAAESIMRLAMANTALGGNPQESFESAVETFTQIGGARREMEQMLSGLQGDFPALATNLGIAMGDVGQAFDAISQDPVRFMQSVRRMYQESSDPGQQMRLRTAMAELGQQFGWVAEGGEDIAAALERALGPIDNAAGAMSRLGSSAAGAAITFSEAMDRMREGFQTQLGTMVRSMPGYQGFERRVLQRQRDAFRGLTRRIRETTEGTSTFSSVVRTMLATRRGGIGGFAIAIGEELGGAFPVLNEHLRTTLPLLGALGDEMFEVAASTLPMLGALGQMGVRFPSLGSSVGFLLNPLTLLIAGLGYLAVRGEAVGGDLERLNEILTGVASRGAGLATALATSVGRVDWEGIGDDLAEGILLAFGAIEGSGEQSALSRSLATILSSVFGAAGTILRGVVRGMWRRVVEWVVEPENVEEQVARGGAALGVTIGTVLSAALMSPLRNKLLRGAGRAVLGVGLRGIPGVGAILGMLLDLPEIIGSFRTEGISGGMEQLLSSALNGFLLGIPRLVARFTGFDLVGMIVRGFMDFSGMGRVLDAIEDGDWTRVIMEGLFNTFSGMLLGIPSMIRMLMERSAGSGGAFDAVIAWARDALGSVGVIVEQVADALVNGWAWASDNVLPHLIAGFETASSAVRVLAEGVEWLWGHVVGPMLSNLWSVWSRVFGVVFRVAVDSFSMIGNRLWELWTETISPVLGLVVDIFREYFTRVWRGAVSSFEAIAGVARWLWDEVLSPVLSTIGAVWDELFGGMSSAGTDVFNGIADTIEWLWSNVVYPVFSAIGRIVTFVIGRQIGGMVTTIRTIATVVWWLWDSVFAPVFGLVNDVWISVFGAIWRVVSWVFRGVARYVSWWWSTITRPVLGALWDFASWVFEGIGSIAVAVFGVVGRAAMWVWENALSPVITWLGEAWDTVSRAIGSVAVAVWGAIGSFITDRINGIVGVVLFLQQSWREMINVMRTGLRLVGAVIAEYIVGPLLRFRRSLLEIVAGILRGVQLTQTTLGQAGAAAATGRSLVAIDRQLADLTDADIAQTEARYSREGTAARLAYDAAMASAGEAFRRANEQAASRPGEEADRRGTADVEERVAPGTTTRAPRRARRPGGLAGMPDFFGGGDDEEDGAPAGGRRRSPLGGPGAPGAPAGGDRARAQATTARRFGAAGGAENARVQEQAEETARAFEISGFSARALQQLASVPIRVTGGAGGAGDGDF
jgi:hypothetical protein